MPIEGVEWLVVGVVILLMLLWSPERIGQIARALAAARREFERAQLELNRIVVEGLKSEGFEDRRLIEVASKLGIKTEGLTREEIKAAIDEKIKILSESKQVSSV